MKERKLAFLTYLEDINPFRVAIDTPVLVMFQSQGGSHHIDAMMHYSV